MLTKFVDTYVQDTLGVIESRSRVCHISWVSHMRKNKLIHVDNLGAGIAPWYSSGPRAGWLGVRVLAGAGNFLFTTVSRPALGATQPPVQWVPEALSLGSKTAGAWSWAHLNLVPRSRMRLSLLPQYVFMEWCTGATLPLQFTFVNSWYTYHLISMFLNVLRLRNMWQVIDPLLRKSDWEFAVISSTYGVWS
jgi:hypothetical protein